MDEIKNLRAANIVIETSNFFKFKDNEKKDDIQRRMIDEIKNLRADNIVIETPEFFKFKDNEKKE